MDGICWRSSRELTLGIVGIIANPAAGKDIRRLVAQGRFVPNQEKINILKRILAGLDATGVEQVVVMPDSSMLAKAAAVDMDLRLRVEFLDMTIFSDEIDSTRAASLMERSGVGCLVTLGGDGTNRAVAKGSGTIPLVPVSTGTNNVFPSIVEGTVAGMAAGVVANGLVSVEKVTTANKRLEIYVDGEFKDIALVDLAVSKERFVGSRAIWDPNTIHEIVLTRAEPDCIGLSAIGAQLQPTPADSDFGIYARLGVGRTTVKAAVIPGKILSVGVSEWRTISVGDKIELNFRPCTIALDGERTFALLPDQQAHVSLTAAGPPVVSVRAALEQAAINGVFKVVGAEVGVSDDDS